MKTQELYQSIYEKHDWYGNADINRCPSVRLIPQYQNYLKGSVIELGCGRGDCVYELRKLGYDCDGIDQVDLKNDMFVGSITKPLGLKKYSTALCIDVIEHIDDEGVQLLFENMKQCERQIFAIHNGESILDGVELHINRKDWAEWHRVISKHFEIIDQMQINADQVLFITENRKTEPDNTPKQIPPRRESTMLNPCFADYFRKYQGEQCILFGTGPSLLEYNHLDGIKIGCNQMVYFPQKMDYYFIGDAQNPQQGYNSDPETYNRYIPTCGYKFIRATPPSYVSPVPKDIEYAKYYNTSKIYARAHELNLDHFVCDIRYQMLDTASISFEMLQFALFCGFRSIKLVGHDCSYAKGTFKTKQVKYDGGGIILSMWHVWKKHIDTYYKNVSIEVINPVALRF